jgi:uncharacterized protein YhaN
MKIKHIHIYGFGKFEDYKISFQPNIQVIYGFNEDGKSTMMEFIKCILFGFQRGQQTYKPRFNKRYGGSITIESSEYGQLRIERVEENKNVTVYLQDGTRHGEAFLQSLFEGIDKDHFQGIFSFGLSGLQHVERIQDTELNDYLLGAGMTGQVSVSEIEKMLYKKQQDLFKASGKKPLINEQLKKIEHLMTNLEKWEIKFDQYENFVKEKEHIELQLLEAKKEKKDKQKQIHEIKQSLTLLPLVEEEKKLAYQLENLSTYKPFPEDGLKRYEQWQAKYIPLKAEWNVCNNKYNKILHQIDELNINEGIIENEEKIQYVRENESVYQMKHNALEKVCQEVQLHDEDVQLILKKLGNEWHPTQLLQANTSLAVKEALSEKVDKIQTCIQRKAVVEAELVRTKNKLNEIKQEVNIYENKMLSKQAFQLLKDKLQQSNKKERLKEKISELENKVGTKKRNSSQFFLGLSSLLFSTILFLKSEFLLGTSILIFIILYVFYPKNSDKNRRKNESELDMLKKEYAFVYKGTDGKEYNKVELENRLKEHEQASYKVDAHHSFVIQAENHYNKALEQYEQWHTEIKAYEEQLNIFCQRYHLPYHSKGQLVLKSFELIEEGQKKMIQLQRYKEEERKIHGELAEMDSIVTQLCEKLSISYEKNWTRVLERMNTLLVEEKEKQQNRNKFIELKQELEEKMTDLREKWVEYESRCHELLSQAEVKTEEQFIKKAKSNGQAEKVIERMMLIQSQITAMIDNESGEGNVSLYVKLSKHELEEELNLLKTSLEHLIHTEEVLLQQLSDVTVKINHLEEDGTYAELVQKVEMEKSKLNHLAKEWAVYAVANKTLEKTKQLFRVARLPKVIEYVTTYFSIFTNKRYVKVFAPTHEDTFLVERFDGQRFTPTQLSTGTTEQLYLSIRLALAKVYPANTLYPILIDDIFVNFDEWRTKKSVDVLREFAKSHQVLFFTCHKHLLGLFNSNEFIDISTSKGNTNEGSEALH